MNLLEYKVVFFVVVAVLALFVASPVLQKVLVYPQTEFFTELWLLGPGHMAEGFPYNVTRGSTYNVFLGIANHLGSCAYYVVEVKFRNFTQSGPDSFNRTASALSPVCVFNAFVADEESLELPVSFSFDYVQGAYNASLPMVAFGSVVVNGASFGLGGLPSVWDAETRRFFGDLVFELYIYNATLSAFQYHERYVDLKFNMTTV